MNLAAVQKVNIFGNLQIHAYFQLFNIFHCFQFVAAAALDSSLIIPSLVFFQIASRLRMFTRTF